MDLQRALNKIYSMHQFDIKLGLERIEKLLELIGNPHHGKKYFHVAGSNGKGSTSSFIASILYEAGFNVGLYTSPHLVRFNERIRINGIEISDEYISEFINSIDHLIDQHKPTFFEITTALAFKYFNDKNPDYIVLETGLGGRLDATNVIVPVASVITSISLEHTNILGSSLGKIAFEKAGIIKNGIPVFTADINPEAADVISKRALELNSPEFRFKDFVITGHDSLQIALQKKLFNLYKTGLHGFHQLSNSALAVKTVSESVGISDSVVVNSGLMNVIKNTGIQGRYEVIQKNPKVIFDAAHNVEGVKAFLKVFEKEYQIYRRRELIFGVMRDKDLSSMLGLLRHYFDTIYAVETGYERSAGISEIIDAGGELGLQLKPLENPSRFIEQFRTDRDNECLVVLGSIYLLGELKSKMS